MKKTTPGLACSVLTRSTLAASLLVIGAFAVAAPASAAQDCTGTSQTKIISSGGEPASVIVGTTVSRELTVFSQVEDPCTASVSSEVLVEDAPASDDMEQIDRLGNVASFQVSYQIDPRDLANADAGTWQADVTAHGVSESHATAQFRVLRAARLTASAGPEPVAKGDPITVSGSLTRADWNTHSYRGLRSTAVTLQARRPTATTYVPLRTVSSDSAGRLAVNVTATDDLCFRFVYAGSTTTAPVASGGDCVDVR